MIRTFNWLGQMRVDVPHLRAVESSVVATFDVLAGKLMAGSRAQVVKGFEVIGSSGMASALQISVAGAVLLHPMASENGSVFSVPPTRANEILSAANSRVRGNFTPSQVNYVGVDLLRSADSSTSDLVQFLDSVQEQETPKTVPLGRTLDYVIVISTVDFAITPNIAPIAKITTDGANGVVSVQDARDMLFRLSRGGSVPSETYAYPWPGGRTGTSFTVGDKSIDSLKSFAEAVTTRLWELGGGSHWYSPTADRNVKLVRSGSKFSNGDYFEWDGNTGNLHWKGLRMVFDNSDSPSVWYNDITDVTVDTANLTDLPSGYCIYVDLDRTSNATLTAVKAEIQTLGAPTVPGTRHILAWNNNGTIFTRDAAWPVGVSFLPATKTSNGVVTLNEDPLDALQPVVATVNSNDTVVGAGVQRGATLGLGVLSIGAGAFDSSINIGQFGVNTHVYGTLKTDTINKISANYITSNTGIVATASLVGGHGVYGTGNGAGVGVWGNGGSTNGVGVYGHGGAGDGEGVQGEGVGDGAAVRAVANFMVADEWKSSNTVPTPSIIEKGAVWNDTPAHAWARVAGGGVGGQPSLVSGYNIEDVERLDEGKYAVSLSLAGGTLCPVVTVGGGGGGLYLASVPPSSVDSDSFEIWVYDATVSPPALIDLSNTDNLFVTVHSS